MIESIPLSWRRSGDISLSFNSLKLPLSGLRWIYSGEVPYGCPFEEVYERIVSDSGGRFLIRGCTGEIARFLSGKGCEVMRTGAEGVITLDGDYDPGYSVNELARRGLRWGQVSEEPHSESQKARLSRLKTRSAHASRPYLQYLFRTELAPDMRCFALGTEEDEWLGAITVSLTGRSRAHTEMILRDDRAPVGVMEALFVGAADILSREGFDKLSLGEVPFISPGGLTAPALSSQVLVKEKLFFQSGRFLRFAYNYKNLFRFKNKFSPEWRPVYICASPGLSWRALADLFVKTRYYDLSRAELLSNFKGLALSPLKVSGQRYK